MKLIKLLIQKYCFNKIDIGSVLCPELSNFHPYKFMFREREFTSMEALLQGIKFESIEKQEQIFSLVGVKAKYKGKKSKWYQNQKLYFQGEEIVRDSIQYQEFLDEAFNALFLNKEAQKVLINTRGFSLIHSIGKKDMRQTVLTEQEFISQLLRIRVELSTEN